MPQHNLTFLAQRHPHPRDEHIQFEEEGHKYTILTDPESTYTSVTTWNHSHFSTFDADAIIDKMMKGRHWKPGHKYWGYTSDQIKQQWADAGKEASEQGTKLHYHIECFMNQATTATATATTHQDLLESHLHHAEAEAEADALEWKGFLDYVQTFAHFQPYRTEWMIYDEDLKLAGSIDMVYIDPDDATSLMIYDWKRSKDITKTNAFHQYATTPCISHLPDTNFWHYALQLNTYKAILETKYGKKVSKLCLVRLHPTLSSSYELIPVPCLSHEIHDLLEHRVSQDT